MIMNNSQIELRDFIIDVECVRSGLFLVFIESFILAIIAGAAKKDVGTGLIAFFVATIIFCIPLLGGVCMLVFSFVWSLIIWSIAINFTSPLASWIISIIAFMILISIHMSVIDIKEGVFCYSYLLFEALIAVFLLYMTYKSVLISIIVLVALLICIFLPVIRHIEGLALSVCTGIILYYIALYNLNTIQSGIIGGLAFVVSEGIYIILNMQFSWKAIIEEGKSRKEYEKNEMEYVLLRTAVYEKYPQLEKDFYYFNTCVCQNDIERTYFEADWRHYIRYINDASEVIEFNKWFEDNKLYRFRDYNRDFAQKHDKYKENTDKSDTGNNENFNHNSGNQQTDSIWFAGIKNMDELKKRYKDLLKIYHPDNQAGDTTISQQIQNEYEEMLKRYS